MERPEFKVARSAFREGRRAWPTGGRPALPPWHPLTVHPYSSVQDREASYEFETFEFEVPAPSSFPTLRKGSRNSAVADLQRRLAAAGYSDVAVDGIFGSRTDAAVRIFQRSRRLGVDGIVGPQTWSALRGTPTPPASPNARRRRASTSPSRSSAMGRTGPRSSRLRASWALPMRSAGPATSAAASSTSLDSGGRMPSSCRRAPRACRSADGFPRT